MIHLLFLFFPIATITNVISFITYGGLSLGIITFASLVISVMMIIPMWANTYYILEDEELLIKCGLSEPVKIPYSSITSTKETWSIMSSYSYALAFDRVDIKYGNDCKASISPRNKQEFLRLLEDKIRKES